MVSKTNTQKRTAPLRDDTARFILSVERRATLVGIIGLGYVGVPLARTFIKKGFRVIGFDVDQTKIDTLNEGRSYMRHISDEMIGEIIADGRFEATTDLSRMAEPDALLICVPTPLNEYREPDLSFVVNTTETISQYLRKGQLVALESTTYPGTSDEVMRPILEKSGLSADSDFGIAYSPEREDPGNPNFETGTIPKVVGASSADALEMALALYGAAVTQVVPVSDTRTAEAVKLTENIFRLVNIGLVNELKVIFDGMGIDVWEVIEAAKTKPFGYMPFYPGPGLGGHCIPIDPFYLTWKARADGNPTRFIELAGEINAQMPRRVIEVAAETLSELSQKPLKGARVLVVGIAYKNNIDDMRESPSVEIINRLMNRGSEVVYHDPFIPVVVESHDHPELVGMKSVALTEKELKDADLVIIATAHANIDYELLVEHASAIVDTRNACVQFSKSHGHKITKA